MWRLEFQKVQTFKNVRRLKAGLVKHGLILFLCQHKNYTDWKQVTTNLQKSMSNRRLLKELQKRWNRWTVRTCTWWLWQFQKVIPGSDCSNCGSLQVIKESGCEALFKMRRLSSSSSEISYFTGKFACKEAVRVIVWSDGFPAGYTLSRKVQLLRAWLMEMLAAMDKNHLLTINTNLRLSMS